MTCATCSGEGMVLTGLPYDGNGRTDACPDCASRAEAAYRMGKQPEGEAQPENVVYLPFAESEGAA